MDSAGTLRGPKRISSLDSLRGVAAPAVVILHLFTALGHYGLNPNPALLYVLLGRLPVMVFFALSGFVLARPFFAPGPPSTVAFLVKRFLRIYPPYIAVAALAAVTLGVGSSAVVPGTIFMDGTPAGVSLNPPSWSLVVEMRLSLIFPLLVAAVRRAPWTTGILGGVAAIAAAIVMPAMSGEPRQPTDGFTYASSFIVTAYYAPLFIGGILLARYSDEASAFVRARLQYLWLATAALIAVGYFVDLALDVAPVILVALVPETAKLVELFKARAIVWLGRVSFSLYLIHAVVLLSLWSYLKSGIAAIVLFIPVSLVLAELSYRVLERPTIRLGAMLAAAIDGSRHAAADLTTAPQVTRSRTNR
jgi:peptidoglycan/LPS O-acetylase OafA/YrhL